jgi:hypothetical protein
MANKAKSVETAEKAVSAAVSKVKDEVKKAETVVVHMIGSVAQKTGAHGIYADGRLVAEFHDGVAEVSAEVAKLLKSWGLAE